MPYSLVLNLLPSSPISPKYTQGRHLHALFLSIVNQVDTQLSTKLHQQKTNKAFTLSPLQVLGERVEGIGNTHKKFKGDKIQYQHHKPISANTPCWWRISLLDESLFSQLMQLWLNLNPQQPWRLGNAHLQITSILGTSQATQPWANAISYSSLYQQASETNNKFTFSFATPTTFSKQTWDSCLPTPQSIFNNLLKRWNLYSGIEIPETVVSQESLDSIYPSFFNIHTEVVHIYRSKIIGCVGDISYFCPQPIDSQQLKYLNVLSDFALYCGLGKKTTMGMGMVRRINAKASEII